MTYNTSRMLNQFNACSIHFCKFDVFCKKKKKVPEYILQISLHLISAIKMKIANVEKEIDTEQKNLDYWKDYKDKGQHDHKKEVYILTKELEDMENSFNEMIGKGNNFVIEEITLT